MLVKQMLVKQMLVKQMLVKQMLVKLVKQNKRIKKEERFQPFLFLNLLTFQTPIF